MVTWLAVGLPFWLFDLWGFLPGVESLRLSKLDTEGTAVAANKRPNFIIKRPRI